MNAKLISFLIEDVRVLIEAVNNNPELSEVVFNPNGESFRTLGDFAHYWSRFIDNIGK